MAEQNKQLASISFVDWFSSVNPFSDNFIFSSDPRKVDPVVSPWNRSGWDWLQNAFHSVGPVQLFDPLTGNQLAKLGQRTYEQVKFAGGSEQQAQAARDEVLNFHNKHNAGDPIFTNEALEKLSLTGADLGLSDFLPDIPWEVLLIVGAVAAVVVYSVSEG